ncbi:hypothetical protein GCM10007049_23750 [Echinicola pacifica]|uniref:Uncharacterized protein n=1 Tax=Echinicola pacifica TaxID=346377 RepID=A0A918Q2N7_9BACT|nr:hypothetical protein [Echinicola pacifica]GGZ30322.1 hypothetical protein GCM10007049_23750 [Echinicola pacifica]
MKWIKKIFIKYKSNKKRPANFEKSKKSIEDIKSIHILACSYENLVKSQALIQDRWDGELEIIGKIYQKSPNHEGALSYKDFDLFGSANPELQEFIKSPSDLMILTFTADDPFITKIIRDKISSYKAGFYYSKNLQLLDIMVQPEGQEMVSNLENLVKYLKHILKK